MTRFSLYPTAITLLALLPCATLASAQTAPSLGSAQSFAVLAGSAVTNTGLSIIAGDLGVSPGTSVTGFPPGVLVSGTVHSADAVALAAQTAVTTAYDSLAGQPCTQDLTGQDLGGLTLTAGVYCFSSVAQLTGTLTLNAQGNANAVFIFKIGSSLTTASGSSVAVINGGTPCNAFWQVGSSATLGTATSFAGNVLALTSITVTTGASLTGRALARTGAVTLDTSAITNACGVIAPPVCPTVSLAPAILPNGTATVAYSQALTARGGAAPYTFAVTSGVLPAGLTLTAAGVLAGTPTTATTSSFVIRATDANACTGSATYSLVVAAGPGSGPGCPAITLSPAAPRSGTVGVAYTETLVGSGGTPPYTFVTTAGALPAGLTISAAGVISGTPTTSGTSTFTIRGTDAAGCFGEAALSISIATAVPTLPQFFAVLLALALAAIGYARVRRGGGAV